MKLFYQLSLKQQDAAIEHCADLVANNAIENGLRIEATNDEEGKALKKKIDSILKALRNNSELKSREEKLQFLMEDETFSDTIFELASEMAHNAFYHDNDELVVFTDALDARSSEHGDAEYNSSESDDDDSEDDDDIDSIDDLMSSSRKIPKRLLN